MSVVFRQFDVGLCLTLVELNCGLCSNCCLVKIVHQNFRHFACGQNNYANFVAAVYHQRTAGFPDVPCELTYTYNVVIVQKSSCQ
jgi:hypothetical protein